MDYQEVNRVVDRNFDPSIMRCSFDITLYEDQRKYSWAVLLKFLVGPLGKACMRKYRNSCDSRGAYFEHEKLQQ